MLYSSFLWWLVVHKSAKQMMDFQMEMGGWLEEPTLFIDEKTCHPTSDLYPEGKDAPAFSDIGDDWLDEKLDLSVFGFPDNWLEPQNDSCKMIAEDASISVILDSWMGSNPVGTGIFLDENEVKILPDNPVGTVINPCENGDEVKILPDNLVGSVIFPSGNEVKVLADNLVGTDIFSVENEVKILPDIENIAYEVLACGKSLSSPSGKDPNSFTEEPNSSHSDFSSPVGSPTSSVCSSFSNPLASPQENKSEIFEYISILSETSLTSDPYIEDISEDVESDQNSVGPIFSTSGKSRRSSPYESKKAARRERKKVQNKEAAARYRTKKRNQDKELNAEVEKLESEQKKLQAKYDQLKNEFSYLKNLMEELKKRKGLSK